MMNKKRLAALALSAVMAAGTVSIPVNAADFSDGAAVQEATAEVEAFSEDVTEETPDAAGAVSNYAVDKASVVWNLEKGTVSFNVTNGTETPVVYTDKQAEKQLVEGFETATCTVGQKYVWVYKVSIGDWSDSITSDPVSGAPLDHADQWVDKTEIIKAGSCIAGTKAVQRTGKYCNTCKTWIEGQYTDTEVDAQHTLDGVDVKKYEELNNVVVDKDGNATLVDKTKDGSWKVNVYQKCVLCGEEVLMSSETKELKATDATEGTRTIIEVENIKSNLIGLDPTSKDFPKDEDIQLTDCSKDGSYTVKVEVTGDSYTYDVTVKAHHVTTNPTLEYVNKADEGLLSWTVKDGKLVVANSTCVKEVPYYEVVKCTSCDKEVSKTEKVAAKSTNHIYDTAKYDAIKAGKDTPVNVADLGANGKTVKVVPETATCEAAGTVTVEFYCQACGEKAATITGVKVNALGHQTAYKTENEVDATCEKAGTYDLITYCERCGKELKKVTVTGKKLPHTNETATGEANDAIKNSDVFIDFIGSYVAGEYEVGQTIDSNVIGEDYATLTAMVGTNCAMCHNNPLPYADGNDDVTLTVVNVVKETYDRVYENGTYKDVVTKLGTITVKASYTTSEGKTVTADTSVQYCSDPNADIAEGFTGLFKDADGVYRYYINSEFADDYAGIVEYGDGEFFVANGLLCKDANGLNLYDGTWYMLANGQIQRNYNGLALYDGEWFYVTNGELNENVNGIVNYNGGQFLVINGRLGYEVNGLWQNIDGEWYYLANGQVQNQYTGVAQYDGAFFYVVNGVLDSDYNGTVEYDGETFKVVNGMLQ